MLNEAFVDNARALEVLSEIVGKHKQTILKKWLTCLRLDPKYRAHIEKNEAIGLENSTNFLVQLLEDGCRWSDREVKSFLKKIRQIDYSITDLFSEITCLQNAIEEMVLTDGFSDKVRFKAFQGISILRRSLSSLFMTMLENTSLFYELSIENGISGFSQIDPDGVIVYSNRQMVNLAEADTLEGISFDTLFSGSHKKLVKNVLISAEDKISLLQQSQLTSFKGNAVPIGLEMAPIYIGDLRLGSYAKVTDLTKPMEMQNLIFDKFLLGIVRLDKNHRISYTNESFRDLLGLNCKDWKGMNFDELIPDEENREILEEQLSRRFKGDSDEYNIKLYRRDDKRTIPVRISASPEMDLQGNVIGTMGIIRCIVRENMHKQIEKQKNAEDLLKAISSELRAVVPYDSLYIALFNSDMKHVRNFFALSASEIAYIERRWWEMSPAMIEWAKQKKILTIPDLKAFYDKDEFKHLKKELIIRQIIERYKSFIYYPIFKDDNVMACVILYSKSEKPYGHAHRRLLRNLPLDSAILTALHYDEKNSLEFVINLLKKISVLGDDLNKIAHTLTKEIAAHYQWENVSVFKVDRGNREFVLLSQVTSSEEFRIPTDYKQPLQSGILGLMYKSKKAVNVRDVKHPKWKDIYISTVAATRSELCLPIESGDLFWLLNIEDQLTNGFSKEEVESLQSLINEISVFLERAWLSKFLEKSMQETSDAVISTNFHGDITFINSAAIDLLGYAEDELLGERLAQILVDKEMANFIINAPKIPNTSVTFLTKQGDEVKLLLSKFKLHEEFSTNIIVAKKFEIQIRLEELNFLKKMYSEIAFQTKTPLTLVFSWLNRIKKRDTENKEKDIFSKIIRQLRKLELTFDRLALYDKDKIAEPDFPYNEILLSIKEIWQRISDDFPQQEFNQIKYECENENLLLLGDIFQLTFCFETILSYLMRSISNDDKILVRIFSENGRLTVKIKGNVPSINSDKGSKENRYIAEQMVVDIALGESIIKQFIANNSGVYQKPRLDGEKIEFKFKLPLAEGYGHGQ